MKASELRLDQPLSTTLSDLAAAGISLFTQHRRLLRLRFSPDSGLSPESLLPHRLHGEEGLSVGYRYTLDCLAPDTRLELKSLLGQPVELGLLLPDGGERLCTGLVTRADQVGADGGFGLFTLTVEPALALLAHRRNSRVWQDKTVPEIVAALLREHQTTHPAFRRSFTFRDATRQRYPIRSYCLQYRETDLAFLERLLAEEGIAYRYIHGPDPERSLRSADDRTDAPADDRVPAHTLVLFDDNTDLPLLTAEQPLGRTGATRPAAIRFHRTAGVETDDALDVWHGTRQFRSGKSTLLSWDYKTVAAHVGDDDSAIAQGEAGDPASLALEDYDPQTLYYGSDPDEMARYANLRQQAKDRATKTFTGEGSVRRLIAGGWFPLADHPLHDADGEEDRQFLVTRLTFAATNNLLPKDADPFPLPADSFLAPEKETAYGATPYRAKIEAIRKPIRYVPDYSRTAHQKPTAPGGTTATVVGPEGEEIFTDEHGRIKLQFHWQRKQDHPDGGADRDERSSTWVRVAYPSAGAAWGTQYIPRIGQEVLVSFLENDIDRPVVTGVLHNGTHRPPTFSGAGSLPANKTLSGHKSKEYKGSGYNELLLDDSTGELRTKLSSEHGKTQLNQGYLIHPRTDGKGEPRGEGFELRTDESGALRAAKGLLLSTDARLKARGRQLDRAELIGILQVLGSLQQQLADLANTHQADETDTQKLTELKQHVENWENGNNAEGGKPDPAGGQPIIAATAPAGFVVGSASNIALAAENHIDLISNQNIQMSAGRRWLARAAESISLFAHRARIKLIAANDKIEIQAHNNNIEATAAKKIVLTGLEEIVLNAPKISFIASGARIDLGSGAITTQCSGIHEQKAGFHKLTGPGGGSVGGQLPGSEAAYDEKFRLRFNNGKPVANTPAVIRDAKGKTLWSGTTNAQGEADILKKDLPENIRIEFKDKA
jgi:type VI secretion system secreted protein VgrG